MVLLTSSAISVAISSGVVFLFTTALFLSGYVLQQQTVRDIRAAIKPQPVPTNARMYLPTQFQTEPTSMPQVGIVDDVVEVEIPSRDGILGAPGETVTEASFRTGEQDVLRLDDQLSPAEILGVEATASPKESMPEEEVQKPLSRAERRKKIKEEILAAGEGEGFKGYKRRMW